MPTTDAIISIAFSAYPIRARGHFNVKYTPGPSFGQRQRICTEPETLTTTCALPASTGTGASEYAADLASMAIARGRGPGDISLLFTDTSRRL